jgi:hypothetical protein
MGTSSLAMKFLLLVWGYNSSSIIRDPESILLFYLALVTSTSRSNVAVSTPAIMFASQPAAFMFPCAPTLEDGQKE